MAVWGDRSAVGGLVWACVHAQGMPAGWDSLDGVTETVRACIEAYVGLRPRYKHAHAHTHAHTVHAHTFTVEGGELSSNVLLAPSSATGSTTSVQRRGKTSLCVVKLRGVILVALLRS